MKILAFSDQEFRKLVGGYVVQVNPSSYTIQNRVIYKDESTEGIGGEEAKYVNTKPEELSFEFLFDSTGALDPPLLSPQHLRKATDAVNDANLPKPIPPGTLPTNPSDVSREMGVVPDIEIFKRFALGFDGAIHRPRFLILNWGTLVFHCVLVGLSIEYKLFRPSGVPVRAVAKATFKNSKDYLRSQLEANKNSPDLTHQRVVKAGDTLPGLCSEIYEDPTLFEWIARENDLTSLFDVQEGMTLVFPPLVNRN